MAPTFLMSSHQQWRFHTDEAISGIPGNQGIPAIQGIYIPAGIPAGLAVLPDILLYSVYTAVYTKINVQAFHFSR
jgi:hypothetical protein